MTEAGHRNPLYRFRWRNVESGNEMLVDGTESLKCHTINPLFAS